MTRASSNLAAQPPGGRRTYGNDVRRVLAMADVHDRYDALSMEVEWGSGEELGRRVRAETEKWARLVKEAGIKFAQ